METTAKISTKFVELLAAHLSDAQWKQMCQANLHETNPSICHSHDFCDANVVMQEAFEAVMERAFNHDSESDSETFNKAWELAGRTMGKLKACTFTDAEGIQEWQGYAHGSDWNGFDNVSVTPEVWQEMRNKWVEDGMDVHEAEDMAQERKEGPNGLVYLGHGLCMSIVEPRLPVQSVTFCSFKADGDDTIWPGFDLGTTTPNCGNNVMVTNSVWQRMIVKWAEDEIVADHVLKLQKEFTADTNGMVNLSGLNITKEPSPYPQPDLLAVVKAQVDAWTAWGASDVEPEYITQGRGLVYGVPLLSQGCYVMASFDGKLCVAPMKNDGTCDTQNWGLCEDMTAANFIADVNAILGTSYTVKQ